MKTVKRKVAKFNIGSALFTVIGISSHENDYRLSWSINEHLGLAFSLGERLVTASGNEFTCFVHKDDERTLTLVSNRCDNGFLLNKYRNLDFILKVDAELNETEITEWIQNLRKTPFVSTAFHIPLDNQLLQLLS
jgi:hypothetical protein